MGQQLKLVKSASPALGAGPAPQTKSGSEVNGPTDRLITAQEVAYHLGLPVSWVYRAARRNEIPVVRIGKYRRFYFPAVQNAIEQKADNS